LDVLKRDFVFGENVDYQFLERAHEHAGLN